MNAVSDDEESRGYSDKCVLSSDTLHRATAGALSSDCSGIGMAAQYTVESLLAFFLRLNRLVEG
jgi:hypothetical protein